VGVDSERNRPQPQPHFIEVYQRMCTLLEQKMEARAWAQTERQAQMWARTERAQAEREARTRVATQTEPLAFPGAWTGWAWWALSRMEARVFVGPWMGWALLRTEAWHMRRHTHSLWQMLHQVLHAYLIAHHQHRDHCEPGGACP
jgi:hypothetical protein